MLQKPLSWLGIKCKGITVYVTGSREQVVLETHKTAKEKTLLLIKKEQPLAGTQLLLARPEETTPALSERFYLFH